MSKTLPKVAFGFLGTTLDVGSREERWGRWRPTVSLFQHADLLFSRFELFYPLRATRLAELIRSDIRKVSPDTEVNLVQMDLSDPWDLGEVYSALFDYTRAYPFKPEREEYLIHITTGTHISQICMFLLTESHTFPGKLIQTSPPDKRGPNHPGKYSIIDLDLSKYDRVAQRFAKERVEGAHFLKSGIATRNRAFNELIEKIEAVAIRSRDPILLMGPTGAGKSRLAERIFELKRLRHQMKGKFVGVNCATLRGDGAMSVLFGHVKGAFTGAMGERSGLLRTADGGVLFLDEIGELGLDEQAMLLHAIEEKCFFPLGSDKEVRSEFQLIAGTNRDLAESVANGSFREDLLARLNLWTFHLPGLRDRREDIEPNLDYELESYAEKHKTRVSFSREARDRFLEFALSPRAAWRGNFRELNAALTRMATLSDGGRITIEGVNEEIERLQSTWLSGSGERNGLSRWLPPERIAELDLFDRLQLESVIDICRKSESLSEAGRLLFSNSREKKRSTNDADRLRKYLARFGLEYPVLKRGVVE